LVLVTRTCARMTEVVDFDVNAGAITGKHDAGHGQPYSQSSSAGRRSRGTLRLRIWIDNCGRLVRHGETLLECEPARSPSESCAGAFHAVCDLGAAVLPSHPGVAGR